jgi:hypothetical protein
MAWAGWGAGAAGAGSAGGPSRGFLVAAAVGSAVVTVVLALDRAPAGLVTGAATVYFVLRATGRIAPKDKP